MAAFWWDGFDLYGTGANLVLAYNGGSTFSIGTGSQARTGSSSLQPDNLIKSFPTNMATVWAGFAYRPVGAGGNLCWFRDSGTRQLQITHESDGSIKILSGSGTLLDQSAAGLLTVGVYSHIIIKATCHSGSGVCEVYVNETLVADCSGVDTATGTANNYSNQIELDAGYIDDFWLSDANEGDCRVIEQLPTGAGNYSQFGSGGGGANYTNVDETTPNGDTSNDYNSASVVGYMDSFTFPALGVTGDVKGVKALFNCKGDVGSVDLRPFLRISTTDHPGTTESVNTTYTYRGNSTQWLTNPATSGAWVQATLEAAEVGYEKR